MAWLRRQGWRTLAGQELRAGLAQGAWPGRAFAITFDDGFASVLEHALPVLHECGFTATVFVVAHWVGAGNDWPGQPAWAPRRPLLDWAGLRRLVEAGWEMGAHSLSHPRLSGCNGPERQAEIADGRRIIEDKVGWPVRTFAYPYGETSPALEALVAETYELGFGTRLGYVTPASRATALERVDAYYLQQPAAWRGLDSRYLAPYLSLRSKLREARRIIEGVTHRS